ncbi:suppressor of lurcher protein 1-like [Schistocerca nitens]|uniref:suppressor of lurcher protein 1-like n=1 Tax=Schistocerca nitens TaxID=7011 RepID=UPI002117654C|nr:suppressor of lurcher protein 1-like [Schistocerca nitens]
MLLDSVMEPPLLLHLLLLLLIAAGNAINPGCECVLFTSTFGKEFGAFSSPDYPRPYPADIDCLLYSFVGGPHDVVHIVFVDFDVQKTHLECSRGDHVEVFLSLGPAARAEVSERTVASGVLCGGLRDVPTTLYSQGPALVLAMHSDSSPGNNSGFLGRFRFLDRRSFRSDGRPVLGTECDQLFSSGDGPRSGRFFSPRYPSSYPSNTTCKYYFRARDNERIRLVFEEVSLQKGDVSCLESPDMVSVFDGPSPSAAAVAVLCDEASHLEVLSTGSSLYVELTARSRWPGQGFRASFQFQGPGDANHATGSADPRSCDVTVDSDGRQSGLVQSPRFPAPYPATSRCRYEFVGRGRQRVRLLFTDFRLGPPDASTTECDAVDAVSVLAWSEGRQEQVWSACGAGLHQPPLQQPLMSSGPRLTLELRARGSGGVGFQARYTFVNNLGVSSVGGRQLSAWPCAFSFNSSVASAGRLSTPNFPGLYPRDTECHYFFHGRPGQRVAVRFHYFDVEGVEPCEAVSASDYVELSNYMGRDRKFPRFCGQRRGFDAVSDGKYFRLTFRSNGRLDATGFNASFRFFGPGTDSRPARREQDQEAAAARASGCVGLWALAVLVSRLLQRSCSTPQQWTVA